MSNIFKVGYTLKYLINAADLCITFIMLEIYFLITYLKFKYRWVILIN